MGDKCTIEDVDYAIEKIKGSLEDIAIDMQTGKIDADLVIDGISSKKKKMIGSARYMLLIYSRRNRLHGKSRKKFYKIKN